MVENIPIQVLYRSKEEFEHIFYRSKIEIQGQVRIVQIPGYDSCACCAPHVKTTGSVGIIKLVGAIHYKGEAKLKSRGRCVLCRYQDMTAVLAVHLMSRQQEAWESLNWLVLSIIKAE